MWGMDLHNMLKSCDNVISARIDGLQHCLNDQAEQEGLKVRAGFRLFKPEYL